MMAWNLYLISNMAISGIYVYTFTYAYYYFFFKFQKGSLCKCCQQKWCSLKLLKNINKKQGSSRGRQGFPGRLPQIVVVCPAS